MKKNSLFFSLLLCFNILFAQTDSVSKYADLITAGNLKKNLTVIASSEMEGRETGTEGQRKAAAYIEEQFRQIGLQSPQSQNGYQQFYPLYYRDSITESIVKFDKKVLKPGQDFSIDVSDNDSKKVTGKKMVFVGYGISEKNYDDYKGKDVKGKVVVFFMGEPRLNGHFIVSGNNYYTKYTYPGISQKIKIARDKGAIAALVIGETIPAPSNTAVSIKSITDELLVHKNESGNTPHIFLSEQAAKKILTKWKPGKLIDDAKLSGPFNTSDYPELDINFSLDYKKQSRLIRGSNVIGIIEGTDKKDEYVFITGHYDHLGEKDGKIYYGADDDGSGTCAVIQMANAFAKAKADGKGPRRTMVFMTLSGEEKGLLGSEYYSEHPVFPLDKTSADLNTDMVGRIDTERETADSTNYVYVIGHDKLSTDLQVINEGVNNRYTHLVLDYKFDDPNDEERIYYRSDHYNFARKGVPVLFFYDGMLKGDYHKPTDTIDKINWQLYEKRVRLIFYTAWEIANRDSMLKRDLSIPE